MYWSTLNTLLAACYANNAVAKVVSPALCGIVCPGLQRAPTQSNATTAWTLHSTLGGILEELGFHTGTHHFSLSYLH